MRDLLVLILGIAILTSCVLIDEETKLIMSPTTKYSLKATVNRTNKAKPNYGFVIIHVYKSHQEIFDFNSGAGDVQKWALGWTTKGDTIILQTSDIGDRAWSIRPLGPAEIKMTKDLHKRASELKAEKFK